MQMLMPEIQVIADFGRRTRWTGTSNIPGSWARNTNVARR